MSGGTDESDGMVAVWLMLGAMFAFKVGLTIYILVLQPTADNLRAQIFLNWPFIVGPIVLLALPALFWWRLLRVRARRARLLHAEWHVEPESSAARHPGR